MNENFIEGIIIEKLKYFGRYLSFIPVGQLYLFLLQKTAMACIMYKLKKLKRNNIGQFSVLNCPIIV